MAFKFKMNTAEFTAQLKDKATKMFQVAAEGMLQGMRFFEGDMIKAYYSGRKGDNTGLFRRSGTLAKSWVLQSEQTQDDFIVTWGNRMPYARIHEYGGTTGRGGGTFLPARTNITEDIKIVGRDNIIDAMVKRIKGVLVR